MYSNVLNVLRCNIGLLTSISNSPRTSRVSEFFGQIILIVLPSMLWRCLVYLHILLLLHCF